LSKQKRLEHNSTVRDQVRFVAYFLMQLSESFAEASDIRFHSLIELEAMQGVEAEALMEEAVGSADQDADDSGGVAA